MDRYKLTFKTWDKVASLYEATFMDLNLYDGSYDIFCDTLKEGSSILEIGCGPGNVTKYILSKRPDLKLEGIDISPNMIHLAQKNIPTATFSVMDCRDIDKITNIYDSILCGFCLPYLSEFDRGKFIMNCGYLLQKQGILYISFVEGKSTDSGFITGSTGDKMYFYYHVLDKLIDELMDFGMEVDHIINVTYPKYDNKDEMHTIVIARKL